LEFQKVGKLKKILEGCLDLILSPSPSVNFQIVGAKIAKCDETTLANISAKVLFTHHYT
jgi:hypothetical protein